MQLLHQYPKLSAFAPALCIHFVIAGVPTLILY